MKTGNTRLLSAADCVVPESAAVAAWYAAHPDVRRLWAVKDSCGLRVIVALEPTHDGNDTHPAWIANSHAWARELRLHTDSSVRLERSDEPTFDEIAIDFDGVLVAALSWRDPSDT